ncbi:molybdate transport system ATP-binding protein [Sanguibacter gelidistatuariae]|uniref:Molybdate transport system ATP-binding protein n=1 Tax=Sanguibacter gelidistatuariae TaxID=1814289 RepID=A0A1G6GQQ3_9MICO|nr:ABC transporter ATP-binding protein [Sanguibacter gelidistatuariae]SDB84278.1 molybdate transport system ATP-binding protein [Sanguibacter gelidistatuariae]
MSGERGAVSGERGAVSGERGAAPGDPSPERRGAVLDADLRVSRGTFTARARLCLAGGDVLALLGPNGAGKSTLLAALAGLLLPDDGHIRLDGADLTRVTAAPDDARGRGPHVLTQVPPSGRGVGLLSQDPMLFPHLSALANVAFGPRAQGVTARTATAQAALWLERVGLDGLGDRRPAELSGGQQQRVAIARALAAAPRLLLLDEPFASLDVDTAPAVRRMLRDQLRASGTTAVVVTHDVLDAVVLADQTAVLVDGEIVDEGPTARVLVAPRSPFTASIAGVNLVLGTADDGALVTADGLRFAGAHPQGAGRAEKPDGARVSLPDGAPVAAVFRPAAVIVGLHRPEGASPRNVWPATITSLEHGPNGIRVQTTEPAVAADLTAGAVAELGLAEGTPVWLSVKATEVALHAR